MGVFHRQYCAIVIVLALACSAGCGGRQPASSPTATPTTTGSTPQVYATRAGGVELVPPPADFKANHSGDRLGWGLPGKDGTLEASINVKITQLPIGSRQPLSVQLARNPNLTVVAEGRADVAAGSGNGLLLEQEGYSPGGLLGKGQARYVDVLYEEDGIRYQFTLVALRENIDRHREALRELMKSLKKR